MIANAGKHARGEGRLAGASLYSATILHTIRTRGSQQRPTTPEIVVRIYTYIRSQISRAAEGNATLPRVLHDPFPRPKCAPEFYHL